MTNKPETKDTDLSLLNGKEDDLFSGRNKLHLFVVAIDNYPDARTAQTPKSCSRCQRGSSGID